MAESSSASGHESTSYSMNSERQIRVLHMITGLGTGGAEMALYNLLSATDRHHVAPFVLSLRDQGTMGERIAALGVPLSMLEMLHIGAIVPALWRLRRLVRQIQPDVIQGWMYHGNINALIASSMLPRPVPVLWGIHQSLAHMQQENPATVMLIRMGALLSSLPARISYVGYASARDHEALGYTAARRSIIPNGVDGERFKPSLSARVALRQLLDLSADALLVGLVARYHPMKDHASFIQAAALLAPRWNHVHFVLSGKDVTSSNSVLMQQIAAQGLVERMHLLGERHDIPAITAGLDIAVSASAWGEAFRITIAEAMACGVPCVVTDVADSQWLINGTGLIVPPQQPQALARALAALVDLGADGRARLGQAARQHVLEQFGLQHVAHQYEELYRRVTAS